VVKYAESAAFTFEAFNNSKVVVHCPTKEEAIEFCSYCSSRGLKWAGGGQIAGYEQWEMHREEMVYRSQADELYYGRPRTYSGDMFKIPIVLFSDTGITSKDEFEPATDEEFYAFISSC
jgi:hypothetical protein